MTLQLHENGCVCQHDNTFSKLQQPQNLTSRPPLNTNFFAASPELVTDLLIGRCPWVNLL